MRNTFDIAFYCKASKADRFGNSPIQMSISINGTRNFINLPMKVAVSDFQRKRKPQYIEKYLSSVRLKANEMVASLELDGKPLTTTTFREYFRCGGTPSYTVDSLFNDFLMIQRKRVGIDLTHCAYRKYELTRDLFLSMIDRNREAESIKPADIEAFYSELKTRYEINSSASYMAKVRTFFKFAFDNGRIRTNPFSTVQIKREVKNIEFLTDDEIAKVMTTHLSTPALERIRDCFLIQVFSGLSYVDLEALNPDDIREENGLYYIHKPRQKTKVFYTAVLFPEAVNILRKYDFKLPIVSNQKTNSALKAIARECGITKNIHSHIGRKTYGCLLLNGYNGSRPVSMEVTAKCLGHSNSRTTARYYATMHQDTVLNELAQAFAH